MWPDGVIVLAAAPVLAVTSYGIWVAIDEVQKWRMRRAHDATNGRTGGDRGR
jgi:hypothetical protein